MVMMRVIRIMLRFNILGVADLLASSRNLFCLDANFCSSDNWVLNLAARAAMRSSSVKVGFVVVVGASSLATGDVNEIVLAVVLGLMRTCVLICWRAST